jgi:hypothetical protein
MENSETIKRSIRIPIDLHNKLEWKSKLLGKTVNQVILEDLGRLNGVEVGDRRRGRRWN